MKSSYYPQVILVISVLFHLPLLAQYQKKIDSLLIVLQTAKEDTSKVNTYGRLCWNYGGLRTEMAKTRAYADSALWLSEKLGYEEGIIDAHLSYGMVNRYEDNYAEALEHLKTYVEYHKRNKNLSKEVPGWFQMGAVYQLMGDYDKSLAAHEYILKIHEENENWHGYVASMNSIGIIYKRIGKYGEAIKSYTKAIEVNDKYGLNRDLTYISHNMGNAYAELKQYDQALGWYQNSLELAKRANNDYAIAGNLTAIGKTYNLMQRYEEALTEQLKAVEYREKSSEKNAFSYSLIELGYTYFKLKKYKQAEQYLLKGLRMAREVEAKQVISDACGYLTELYAETGNYRKAYEYGQLYHEIKDSIFSETRMAQIEELQTKYETAEKDKQIALLAKEKELQENEVLRQTAIRRNLVLGSLLLLLIAGLIVYALYQRLKNQKAMVAKNNELKEVNFKRQLSELRMKVLQAQMNPHFVFNCMNSINQMILAHDYQNASKYLTKLGKLVRLILENAEEAEISLKDELSMLEAYMQLETLRFKGKIKYQMNVTEDIDQQGTYVPSMILQPFVENAIWHGLLPKQEDGLITISIEQIKDQLVCLIEDNGVGRNGVSEEQRKSMWKSKSLGLKITEERLSLFSKKLHGKFIQISDLKDVVGRTLGTRVKVNIPIS